MKKFFTVCIIAITVMLAGKTSAQNANTSLSNLTATKINHSLTPGTTNSLSLGSGNNGWRNLYLTNGLYLNNQKFISASGTGNNFIGTSSGNSLTTGTNNTAVGYNSMYYNTTGDYNTAVGYNVLYNNQTGGDNTAIGEDALYLNSTGYYNTATGSLALRNNVNGSYNAAYGIAAMSNNTSGGNNTAIGAYAMGLNTAGEDNTSIGAGSMYNTTGSHNTGLGYDALSHSVYAGYNTAVGYLSGYTYNNGYNNVFLGANTDVNTDGVYNAVIIGEAATGTASNQVTIGNSATNSYRAYANWSNISDGRLKKNIKQNVPGLAFINKLQPVTYNLDLDAADKIIQSVRKDSTGKVVPFSNVEQNARQEKEKIVYTGFVAQDVEKVAKSLNYDFSGVDAAKSDKDVYGLRYAEFVVPLVKAVQELSKKNDDKDNIINNLEKRLSKIESKVNVSQTIINTEQLMISSASIQQNSPNPFSNTTSIMYSLPQTYTSAKVIFTNNNGVIIKQVNLIGKGKGLLNVDTSTLSAGAYQYSLYVDGKLISTKQMISAK